MNELAILLVGLVVGSLLQTVSTWWSESRSGRRQDAEWLREKQWVAYSDYTQSVARAHGAVRDLAIRWRRCEKDKSWDEYADELELLITAVPTAVERVEELSLIASLPTRPDAMGTLQSLHQGFVEAAQQVHAWLCDATGTERDRVIDAWADRVIFFTHELRRFAARELGYRTDPPREPPARPRPAPTT